MKGLRKIRKVGVEKTDLFNKLFEKMCRKKGEITNEWLHK